MPRYAELIYNGYWWSPERLALQNSSTIAKRVNGEVRIKLYKGNVMVAGRRSESDSLNDENVVTFEDDRGAYDQRTLKGSSTQRTAPSNRRTARGRLGDRNVDLTVYAMSPIMRKLFVHSDRVLVGHIASVLQSRGIDVMVRNDVLGAAAGELPVNETWPEVWVVSDDEHSG